MMKTVFFTSLFVTCVSFNLLAQVAPINENYGGTNESFAKVHDEMDPKQRAIIVKNLQENEAQLKNVGKIPTQNDLAAVTLIWPVRKAKGFTDPGFFGISNFVDHNPLFPNKVQDYNCGTRTYDETNGYNHAGTDIFTWPFTWQKMDRNAVEVIAGAAGTIIGKWDGEPDKSCTFCTNCEWNAVYIRHADGSVAWYGHLKAGSLTSKAVGETVAQGEYLAVVGSSGKSTGPHLHLELYTNSSFTQLVDPWAGACNTLNASTSWWQNQPAYKESALNKIMTGSGFPQFGNYCYGNEKSMEKVNFASGDSIYFTAYYKDQANGQIVTHTLYRPDNTVYVTWQRTLSGDYSSSWWGDRYKLPSPATTGTWRYEIVYLGKAYSTYFAVNTAALKVCSDNYAILTANLTGNTYQWQLDAGSGFTNIADGANYSGTNAKQLELKSIPSSFYGYQYRCLVNGSLSHAVFLKFENVWTGHISTAWEDPQNWDCGVVPDAGVDVVIKAGLTNYPVINADAVCRGTHVSAGASLIVKEGVKLTVKGN
jgi:murein DD-endopeptidase MepM/ murein hydrolase activator NlpD